MTLPSATPGPILTEASHPRPQLTRPGWVSLDGAWGYRPDPEDRGLAERWWREGARFEGEILVPFPPESSASTAGVDDVAVHWYRRTLAVEAGPGERVLLHFEAVDHSCDVWVGGQHVAHHEGGFTPFVVDVTEQVDPSGADVDVVVRAHDERTDLEQPRGKQDWHVEPHVIWYRRTSGIWRTVWVEVVPAAHITQLTWQTEPITGRIDLTVETSLPPTATGEVVVDLDVDGLRLATATATIAAGRAQLRASVLEAVHHDGIERLWWSPDNPVLIDARIELRSGGTVDRVGSYLGLRSVSVSGHEVLLNERPLFQRLVLEQAYWPTSHLASPSLEALEEEARWIKRLGFNGLRMHQTSADPRFLELCDRLGLLVWVDAPASFRFSTVSLERTVRGWLDLVRRDRNHPSVITWVPFNESWGVEQMLLEPRQREAVLALYHLTRALDPTRPVIGNDGWEFVAGDVVGVHEYGHDAAVLGALLGDRETLIASGRVGGRRAVLDGFASAAADLPLVLSEFGGFNLAPSDGTWSGYGGVSDAEQLVDRLGELVAAVRGAGVAGFCYTQLTDTEQERNGLLTQDREPKADPERIAADIGAAPA